MSIMRQLVGAQISPLGADEVRVTMSTAALARDGHILVPQGCRLANYRVNPIVLWSHNPDFPIGNAADISASAAQIAALVRFAPLGISHKADEIRGLTKAGVIRAVSVGFDPIEMEPLDAKKPRGGQRISVWELLELSFVSVPADTGAIVTARSERSGKVLSGANAMALRVAHDLAERCRTTIANVLGGAGESRDDDGGADEERAYRLRQLELLRFAGVAHQHGCDATFDQRQRKLDVIELSPRQG